MGLRHGVRNLVLGSVLTAGAVAAMHGVAAAEEHPPPTDSARPAVAARHEDEHAAEATPGTTAEEVVQPPAPSPVRSPSPDPPPRSTSASASSSGEPRARATAVDIVTPGPLTSVQTGPDLNCTVSHEADTEPAFYEKACGTFIAVDGTLYGPDSVRPDAVGPKPRRRYTKVRQSDVTGSGSFADPHKVVTEVGLGDTGLAVTQTDSYVVGQESYRTDVTVANAGPAARTAQLYRAGDCKVGDNDYGFAGVNTASGAVACVGADHTGADPIITFRTQEWYPLSPGSHYYADVFSEVWKKVGSRLPFPDLCPACVGYVDNGAGLSWEITIPAGASVTRSHLTTFSVLGVTPLTITSFPWTPTATPASVATYTVVVVNPNGLTVNLNSIVDTLPAGFSYVPGSTSGTTTLDPTVAGQVLTWSEPLEMPPFSFRILNFSVRVTGMPGAYVNEAAADAGRYAVAPRVDLAAIVVVAGPDMVDPPDTPATVGGVALVRPTGNAMAPLATRRSEARGLVAPGTAGTLPATGSDPQNLLVLATLLLAGGGALVTAGRRPHHR
ncbi:MAG: LPXTG cell wall anchor domain-containing protein [Actinomycetota bacterium]|nr:LPXTG cell wall anchor domain-containing protein [Actinomycetota bacterium]